MVERALCPCGAEFWRERGPSMRFREHRCPVCRAEAGAGASLASVEERRAARRVGVSYAAWQGMAEEAGGLDRLLLREEIREQLVPGAQERTLREAGGEAVRRKAPAARVAGAFSCEAPGRPQRLVGLAFRTRARRWA